MAENPIKTDNARTKTVAIMGTPVSSGNRGVLALGASLINLCSQKSKGSRVVLMVGHHDNQPAPFRVHGEMQGVPVVNVRLSPHSQRKDHLAWILMMSVLYRVVGISRIRKAIAETSPWIKTIADADLVGEVHGGDSFSDIYGIRGLVYTFFMDLTVVLIKGSIVQFPQTYGPFKSRLARFLAKYLLKRSSTIIARDKQSLQIAQDLVGKKKTVLLCPDVAFSLESIRPDTVELVPALSGAVPSGVIGLNINGLMYHGGYTRNNMFGLSFDYAQFLPRLIVALSQETEGEIWLVPHTFASPESVESDPTASQKVCEALPPEVRKRVRIVLREYDQYEIKGLIGLCDFFIGSRMHACIAALSQGIPCVGVAYSMKFAGVFETVQMEEWIVDGRKTNEDAAIERILKLYRSRETVRADLSRASTAARTQLQDTFMKLIP